MPKQPSAECGIYGSFAEKQLKPKENDVHTFLTQVGGNYEEIKSKGIDANFSNQSLLSLASITETINNKVSLKSYVQTANNILEAVGVEPSSGSYIQWISSLNLQTIKTQNNQTFHVLDHPNHIMSNLEDAGVQDILKQIYDSMQLNSNTGFILTNTDIAGRHWKWYFYQKVNLVWCGITSEPTGYNSRDTESIVTGKQLFECILNGAGIANNIFLKDCICLPFMTVRRVIELLTPFSEKLSDAIASEMTQCLNDKWRDAWVDQIIELNTSWMEISDSPLRIEASDLLKELLPALHLSNEEYIVIKDMSASNRGLNLGTVRSMAAFNNLSDTCRKLITNVVIARNIKSIRQINIEQTKSASEMIFTDNVFMEFMDIATNYIYSMNADKLSDVETCAPILANIHKVTVKISKKIRKRAYDDGWNLICSIQQENNNVAIH